MATPTVVVSGPMLVLASLEDDGAANEPTVVLGHSRDGVTMQLAQNYDDVFTDNFGPDAWRDRVMIGTVCTLRFELHSFDRTNLENLLWMYETPGQRARIGRKISDIDGGGKTIHIAFKSLTDQQDLHFIRCAPVRASQRIGTRHSVVTMEVEAIISAADQLFFSEAELIAATTGTEVPEVAGGHLFTIDGTELGWTNDGSELLIEYFYDDVNVDPYGPATNFEKVVTGQQVTVIKELHAYDEATVKLLLGLFGQVPDPGYGGINSIGRLGSAFIAKPLVLDSVLAADGIDWTFPLAVPDGQQEQLFSARHSTVNGLRMVALPQPDGTYYTRAAGS